MAARAAAERLGRRAAFSSSRARVNRGGRSSFRAEGDATSFRRRTRRNASSRTLRAGSSAVFSIAGPSRRSASISRRSSAGLSARSRRPASSFRDESGEGRARSPSRRGSRGPGGASSGSPVREVARARGGGLLVRLDESEIRTRAVILATGGLSVLAQGADAAGLEWAAALGHTVRPTYPPSSRSRAAPRRTTPSPASPSAPG